MAAIGTIVVSGFSRIWSASRRTPRPQEGASAGPKGPALLALALLVPVVASAQTGVPGAPRTGLTVSLRDSDARGIAGATVVVRNAAGQVVSTVTTSADGIARVADITN